MRKTLITLSVFIFLLVTLQAETHLSDDIGGRTFESSGNPFIVNQDVVVPEGTKIVIKPGCVFLFKSFTGINVYGGLFVEGDLDNPIVFSSINDANYNPDASQLPNSFDWNGIYVSEESGDVKLRNFKLMYSVFGIKSKKNQITIQNGNFKQNGQFHFTINDNIHYVQDNISYSYNVTKKTEPKTITTDSKPSNSKNDTKENAETKGVKKRNLKKRRVVAGVLLGVGVVSLGTALGLIVPANNKRKELVELDETDIGSLPIEMADEYKKKWARVDKENIILSGVMYGTGILAGITIPTSLILMFTSKDKSKTVKKVSINLKTGLQIVAVGFTRYF